MRVAHGAAHDPAQDIAAALIGRQHAVGDQEARGAQMIGDDAVAGLLLALGAGLGQLLAGMDQRLERVRVVIVGRALEHGGDPLQPHAGVDGRLREVADDLVIFLQELHEDQVPDLDEAVAVLVRRAGRAARDMVAMVVEDLRTWPATARPAPSPRNCPWSGCG